MLSGLCNSTGGYDYTAIQVVFDIYEVGKAERERLFPMIIKLIDVLETEKQARVNK